MYEVVDLFYDIFKQFGSIIAAFAMIFGIIQCFFGLKIFKIQVAICGFLAGLLAGTIILGAILGSIGIGLAIGFVIGIIVAIIAYKVYRIAVFVGMFSISFLTTLLICIENINMGIALGIVIGIIIGIISLFITKIMVILTTSVAGAIQIGFGSRVLFYDGHENDIAIAILITGIFAIIGVVLQYYTNKKFKQNREVVKVDNKDKNSGNKENIFSDESFAHHSKTLPKKDNFVLVAIKGTQWTPYSIACIISMTVLVVLYHIISSASESDYSHFEYSIVHIFLLACFLYINFSLKLRNRNIIVQKIFLTIVGISLCYLPFKSLIGNLFSSIKSIPHYSIFTAAFRMEYVMLSGTYEIRSYILLVFVISLTLYSLKILPKSKMRLEFISFALLTFALFLAVLFKFSQAAKSLIFSIPFYITLLVMFNEKMEKLIYTVKEEPLIEEDSVSEEGKV